MPSLKHVSVWQELLLERPFTDMKWESLGILTWEDRSAIGAEEDNLMESVDILRINKRQESTLKKLQLLRDDLNNAPFSSINFFLRYLQVGLALPPPLPLLSKLSISKDLVFDVDLLAEVLLSRNLSSRSDSERGVEGERCSTLTLRLQSEHFKAFKTAEKALLSRYSAKLVKAAGKTIVELWDGK